MILSNKLERSLHLMTCTGELTTPITVQFFSNESQITSSNVTSMSVRLVYDESEYIGIGTIYPYMDAFANLQKQLPNGVVLKGCINCVHGNMCPYGDEPYRVYCTKQLIIAEKLDIIKHIEHNDITSQNVREYSDLCDDYCMQSPETYTYTDYAEFSSN